MSGPTVRDNFYQQLIAASGLQVKNAHRGRDESILDNSYHFDKFHDTNAQRNTLDRFDTFGAPADFTNRDVVDIGSNLGALSFESLRRGARRVIGLEPCAENVKWCRELAEHLGVSDRCEFRLLDLWNCIGSPERQAKLIAECGRPDIVFCCAADAGVGQSKLYDFIAALSAETCFLEADSNISISNVTDRMLHAGFESVTRMRTCESGKRHGRRSYVLDKKVLLSERLEQRRYRGYRLSERYLRGVVSRETWKRISRRYLTPNSLYNHRSYRLGDRYVRSFESLELWEKVCRLYARIAHIPYIQQCDLSVPGRLTSPISSRNLWETELTQQEQALVRTQVVALVQMLNQAGVAHRDLHSENVFFDDGQICLVDLEFLEDDPQSLSECYDLTGQGLESPLKSGRMNVFREFDRSLKQVIGLTLRDFGLAKPESDAENAPVQRAAYGRSPISRKRGGASRHLKPVKVHG